jgi:hypothetical protein
MPTYLLVEILSQAALDNLKRELKTLLSQPKLLFKDCPENVCVGNFHQTLNPKK